MSETISEPDYPELPQGSSPNFDEMQAAADDLGPGATLEEVVALAVAYAKRRGAF